MAIESVCADHVRRVRLGRGDAHQDVEDSLEDAHKLMSKLALALFDDVEQGSKVYDRLHQLGTTHVTAVKACNKGSHADYTGDLRVLVERTGNLVGDLARL